MGRSAATYSNTQGDLKAGGALPYIPADRFSGTFKLSSNRINYIYLPYFAVTLSHYMKQNRVAKFETSSPGYDLVDLNFGGSFKWGKEMFDLSLSVTNLLDKGYYSHLSLVRNIGVFEMGRNVSLSLKVPFAIHNPK